MKGGCLLFFGGSFFGGGRVSPRRATHFLLLRQKKVSKEKATLLSASLRFAAGNLRCSITAGVRRTRFAQTAAALIPPPSALLGAYRRGGSGRPSLRSAPRPTANTNNPIQSQPPRRAAPRWPGGRAKQRPVRYPIPSVCAEERSVSRIRARPCLSEASLGETPRNASTAGCPQRSGGSQTVGSPFFCLRFFGEAKKSRSPAGARPGLGKQSPSTNRKPPALTPTLSQRERE
ncbi:hypothetical protein J2W39_001510 [Variovorax paradoxus]|uniref:Uncharacterized protein n=1 Tax=Variovorax paradoxus TaxID=34073 RepID=A0AAW8EBN4_VARPD|nr:hypothetical protein [Variovorax paradoxus]